MKGRKWLENFNEVRSNACGQFLFVVICQIFLLFFLIIEAKRSNTTLIEIILDQPDEVIVVFVRFMCATFVHIKLAKEVK